MSANHKIRFNPRLSAIRGQVYNGLVSTGEFSRLSSALADHGGEIEYEVEPVKQGKYIRIKLVGHMHLRCQRSLNAFIHPVEIRSELKVVDENSLQEPDDGYEQVMMENEQLYLADLIEDELLLAVPLVPTDPDSEPVFFEDEQVIETETETETKPNPFADLAKLKTK